MNNKKYFRILFGLIFISILVILIGRFNIFNKENIQGLLQEGEDTGYILVLIMTTLMIFFVPLTWFTVLAGIAFGVKGYSYTMLSAILGAVISYFIARVFKEGIIKIINNINSKRSRPLDLQSISTQIENYGKEYIYFIRTVPLTPYTLINYTSGISSIKFTDYIVGTIFGLIPSETLNILLIKSVYNIKTSITMPIFFLTIKVIYTLIVILIYRKRRKTF